MIQKIFDAVEHVAEGFADLSFLIIGLLLNLGMVILLSFIIFTPLIYLAVRLVEMIIGRKILH